MNKIEKLIGKNVEVKNKWEIIILIRRKKNISRAELRRIYNKKFNEDKTYMTFWRLENGKTPKSNIRIFYGILEILGISVNDFFEYIENNKINL